MPSSSSRKILFSIPEQLLYFTSRHPTDFIRLHHSSLPRSTNRVLIGNLWLASRMASRALA